MREQRLKGTTVSLLLEVGGLALFVVVVALLSKYVRITFSSTELVLVGVVLALVPALIWLTAFYQQDRIAPEPKRYVLGIFILSALLAQAVGQPVIRDLFSVQDWIYTSPLINILGAIFIVGLVQEFLKYAAVRYTIFTSDECDEAVDGVVYGAAAGLGYATMLNIQYIVGHGGVDLGIGAVRVAVTALAHATFTGVMGYFLGRAKCENMGPLWLPSGLLLAAILNGLITYTLREVTSNGVHFNPWYGLIVALVISSIVFTILFALIRRLIAADVAAQKA